MVLYFYEEEPLVFQFHTSIEVWNIPVPQIESGIQFQAQFFKKIKSGSSSENQSWFKSFTNQDQNCWLTAGFNCQVESLLFF
jgi:hypothetical protein